MIATIIFGIIIILTIILTIIGIKQGDITCVSLGVGFTIGCIMVLLALVYLGYLKKPNLQKKENIEILLEYSLNEYTIEKALEYNYSVNEYNNYWFRFSIENRNEWLIDIDKYLKDVENE